MIITRAYCYFSHDTIRTLHTKRIWKMPRVASTTHITDKDLQIDGLFAGHRPLFLEDSPWKPYRSNELESIAPSFSSGPQKPRRRKLVAPWEISITGRVLDNSFDAIPHSIVKKLRPYQILDLQPSADTDTSSKKIRFNGKRVLDDTHYVDIMHPPPKAQKSSKRALQYIIERRLFEDSMKVLSQSQAFMTRDHNVFQHRTDRLNKKLAKHFHLISGLSIRAQFQVDRVPPKFYVQRQTLVNKRSMNRFFVSRIMDQIQPLLSTITSHYERHDNKTDASKYRKHIMKQVHKTSQSLVWYIPSINFHSDSTDCIVHRSPIPGFGRMIWIKNSKRRNVFSKRNIEKDQVCIVANDIAVTVTGFRHMKFPVNLHKSTLKQAFATWKKI